MHPLLKRINDRIDDAERHVLTQEQLLAEIASINNQIGYENSLNVPQDLMDQFIAGRDKLETYVVPVGVKSFHVAENIDKFNLNHLVGGETVVIDNEGGRVEQYIAAIPTIVGYSVIGGTADGFYTNRAGRTVYGIKNYNLLNQPGSDENYAIFLGEGWQITDGSGNGIYYATDGGSTPDSVTIWLASSDNSVVDLKVVAITQGELDAGLTLISPGYVTNDLGGKYVYNPLFLQYEQTNGGGIITGTVGNWVLSDSANYGYVSRYTSNGVFPWSAAWVSVTINDGIDPAPTVTRNDTASQTSWVIIDPSAYITIRNNWGNGLTANGIYCPSNNDTNLGWCKLNDGIILDTGGNVIYYFELKYNGETMTISSNANLTTGVFIVPHCIPKRCIDLIVNFVD